MVVTALNPGSRSFRHQLGPYSKRGVLLKDITVPDLSGHDEATVVTTGRNGRTSTISNNYDNDDEEDDADWVVKALTKSTESTRKKRKKRKRRRPTFEPELSVGLNSDGSASVSVGFEVGFGSAPSSSVSTSSGRKRSKGKKRKRKTATTTTSSILEAVSASTSSVAKRKRPMVPKVSDREGGGGMVGRLRDFSANNLLSRSLMGAYPGDALPPGEAASAHGMSDLANKYGYGEWSDYDDDDDDHEIDDDTNVPDTDTSTKTRETKLTRKTPRKKKRKKTRKQSTKSTTLLQPPSVSSSGGVQVKFGLSASPSSSSSFTKRRKRRTRQSSVSKRTGTTRATTMRSQDILGAPEIVQSPKSDTRRNDRARPSGLVGGLERTAKDEREATLRSLMKKSKDE